MTDLVERLRDDLTTHCAIQPTYRHTPDYSKGRKLLDEAATALEAKDKELAALREPQVRCDGCGSSWTSTDLAREKANNPKLLSCCPERKPLNIDEWKARAETAERERDEARAALKPFAKAASDYDNRFGDDEPTWGDYGLNLGHLRAARAVIKQGG